MDTSGAKIWLPGISDPDTLDAASRLCGTTALKETRNLAWDHRESRDHYARHPVMTPEMIRQLPARHALIIRGGMSPAIARLPMAWKDPVYKKARRAGHATTALVPEPGATPDDWTELPDPGPGRDIEPAAFPPAGPTNGPSTYPWQ